MADDAPSTATPPAASAAASPDTKAAADKPVQAPAGDPFEKHLLAEGYKSEMLNGKKQYCRREPTLGTRLGGDVKHCGTLDQLKVSEADARTVIGDAQRMQTNPTGH
jgi:hypothetical protein